MCKLLQQATHKHNTLVAVAVNVPKPSALGHSPTRQGEDTLERTECYKWISFILTELDAPLWTIAKHRFGLPTERRVPGVIETADWEFRNAVKVLASGFDDRPYLASTSLTVADILAGHTLLWAKSARLRLGSDSLETYLQKLLARDAAIRASAVAEESA